MHFKLGIRFFQNTTHCRLLLKRQKILYGRLCSSSQSDNPASELVKKSTKDYENKELVKREPEKQKSPTIAEINPRITRLDRREIPQAIKPTPTERRLGYKASQIFDIAAEKGKTKETFAEAVNIYKDVEKTYRRGHVEFIYEGMKRLEDHRLEKDLDSYHILLSVFPKGELIARGPWEVEMMHYPKQQQCAIDLMEKMQNVGVIPDDKFGILLKETFGEESHAFRKFRRILFWMPKFRYADPYPIPHILPNNDIELAVIALTRMAFDVNNKLKIWKTEEVEENPIEDTFIVSAQSPKQRELIEQHSVDVPLYVEGAFTVYLRNISQSYFVLRADPKPAAKEEQQQDDDDDDDENLFTNWKLFYEDEHPIDLQPIKSCHEQDDSTILAMCITGSSSKDSLVTWIRYLQKSNPKLEKIPIVFQLRDPGAFLEDTEKEKEEDQEQENEDFKQLDSPI